MLLYWWHFTRNGRRIDCETDDDSIAAHFLHLLHGEPPSALHADALDKSLILYAEHEFNASTFTARVITSAALIMIFVFGSFLLAGQRVIAEFGIGLASAVFLDAFVLRTVLVPATMHIIGKRNWWLPRGLDRLLPRLAVEGVEK